MPVPSIYLGDGVLKEFNHGNIKSLKGVREKTLGFHLLTLNITFSRDKFTGGNLSRRLSMEVCGYKLKHEKNNQVFHISISI